MEKLTKLELQLGCALAQLLLRSNGRLGQNFYTIPEVKASFYALSNLVSYAGNWMDLDLHITLYNLEEELEKR